MPRGPGKRSNYNLDYSRFNGLENQDQAEERCVDEASTDGAEDFAVALRNMPPELQEAYRLTMISRSTGDEAAQKRANELVLQAVDKGGPQVRETFMKEISGHLPEGTLRGMDDSQLPQNSLCWWLAWAFTDTCWRTARIMSRGTFFDRVLHQGICRRQSVYCRLCTIQVMVRCGQCTPKVTQT
ncbi:rpoC2 [Symbiodinium sp. CCMP2456]|nr:rpoC2 [Symbiodinium sp. CCMP2456]